MTMNIIKSGNNFELHNIDDEEGKPVASFDNPDDCEEYCRSHGYTPRYRKHVSMVKPEFIHDVEERANGIAERFKEYGLVLRSNVTYRASAAWKDQPTHYAYIGDFGGMARLEDEKEGMACSDAALEVANGFLRELIGMANALWELGYNLTFDKDGKHTLFGNYPEWVTVDEL